MDRFVFFLLGAALFGGCAPDLTQGGSSATGGTGGTGGAGSSSTGGAGGSSCMSDGDCMNDECRFDGKCMNGTCTWSFVPVDSPVGTQIYGDCKLVQCDGQGNVETADIMPKDSYVYGTSCYAPDCSQGTNPKSAAVGTACDTHWGKPGVCDDMANCVECTSNIDCAAPTPNCAHGRCVAGSTCNDNVKSGNETDVDCGGSCPPCQGGQACASSADCDRTACAAMVCKMPACDDSFKNGDETDVDCGGACGAVDPFQKCAAGKACLFPPDCQSGKCEAGTCVF